MANVSISLIGGGEAPRADVLELDRGELFVSLKFGEDASLIAPGVDHQCVAYLRALAAVITDAADRVEAARPAAPATEPTSPVDDNEVIF